MKPHYFFILLTTVRGAFSFLEQCLVNPPRCQYGDQCWPDEAIWNAFNQSISGRLLKTRPSAAVCHSEDYNAHLCDTTRSEWFNSFWRTNQTGAYTATLWELGSEECFINSTRDSPCDQGLGRYHLNTARFILMLKQFLIILWWLKLFKIFKQV